jgi:hypothetical protein
LKQHASAACNALTMLKDVVLHHEISAFSHGFLAQGVEDEGVGLAFSIKFSWMEEFCLDHFMHLNRIYKTRSKKLLD